MKKEVQFNPMTKTNSKQVMDNIRYKINGLQIKGNKI